MAEPPRLLYPSVPWGFPLPDGDVVQGPPVAGSGHVEGDVRRQRRKAPRRGELDQHKGLDLVGVAFHQIPVDFQSEVLVLSVGRSRSAERMQSGVRAPVRQVI